MKYNTNHRRLVQTVRQSRHSGGQQSRATAPRPAYRRIPSEILPVWKHQLLSLVLPELGSVLEMLPGEVMDRSAEELSGMIPPQMVLNDEQGCTSSSSLIVHFGTRLPVPGRSISIGFLRIFVFM